MSIHGYLVDLSCHSYETPRCCASCMGPQETQVQANISEKSGNIRTTLKMAFPYCNACAKRARWEKVRQILVGSVAGLLGVAFAVAAWWLDVGVETTLRFALALPIAAALTIGLALSTRGSQPSAPATARGEAVILRDTSGTVLCTNPRFAQLLADANATKVKPAVQHLTVEVWAPLTALLCGTLVLLAWVKEGAPSTTASESASTTTTAVTTAAAASGSASAVVASAAPPPSPAAKPSAAKQAKSGHPPAPKKP